MEVRTFFFSQTVNPSADLDEETLQKIAEQTGGRYFRARNTEELAEIYRELDRLEPIEHEQKVYRPKSELYPWPLGGALLLSMALLAVRLWPVGRRP